MSPTPEQIANIAKNAHRGFYVHPDTLAELKKQVTTKLPTLAQSFSWIPLLPDQAVPVGYLVPVPEPLPISPYPWEAPPDGTP